METALIFIPSKKVYRTAIEYYTTTEKKFKLPERTTINWSIYNILTDMRMEDSDIAEVMVTSPGALRAMKSRMRK